MAAQRTPATEHLVTLSTYTRLCPAVGTLMSAQVTAMTERIVALATDERSRSAVGAFMSAQTAAISECRVAMMAREPVSRTSSLSLGVGTTCSESSRCGLAHFCVELDVFQRLDNPLLKRGLGLLQVVYVRCVCAYVYVYVCFVCLNACAVVSDLSGVWHVCVSIGHSGRHPGS